MKKLSVIVVGTNERNFLSHCFSSILKELEGLPDSEIIFVDNGSTDGSSLLVRNNFPSIKIIENKKNLGLTVARNRGFGISEGEYLIFLDADTEVCHNTFKNLLAFVEGTDFSIGIVGPKIIYKNGDLQYSCRRFPSLLDILLRGLHIKDSTLYMMKDFDHSQICEVDWVMGACMVIKRKLLENLSGFDTDYFVYYDDIDLCWRAGRAGWKTIYYPDAQIVHCYQRRSSGGGFLNPLKWSHLASFLRFFIKKSFS